MNTSAARQLARIGALLNVLNANRDALSELPDIQALFSLAENYKATLAEASTRRVTPTDPLDVLRADWVRLVAWSNAIQQAIRAADEIGTHAQEELRRRLEHLAGGDPVASGSAVLAAKRSTKRAADKPRATGGWGFIGDHTGSASVTTKDESNILSAAHLQQLREALDNAPLALTKAIEQGRSEVQHTDWSNGRPYPELVEVAAAMGWLEAPELAEPIGVWADGTRTQEQPFVASLLAVEPGSVLVERRLRVLHSRGAWVRKVLQQHAQHASALSEIRRLTEAGEIQTAGRRMKVLQPLFADLDYAGTRRKLDERKLPFQTQKTRISEFIDRLRAIEQRTNRLYISPPLIEIHRALAALREGRALIDSTSGLGEGGVGGEIGYIVSSYSSTLKRELEVLRLGPMHRLWRGLGVTAAIWLVLLTAGILWAQSFVHVVLVARSLQMRHWDDVLAIEPDNLTALVGRANDKVNAIPPDIEGAFSDLHKADLLRRDPTRSRFHQSLPKGGLPTVRAVQGDAYAIRALQRAQGGRLDAALQDLTQAREDCESELRLDEAQAAVSAGFLGIAQEAARASNVARLQQALAAARIAGAADESLLAIWEQYALVGITALNTSGLALASAEGEKLGLTGETQAGWWLELAVKASQPPRSDTEVLHKALEAAKAAGATEESITPLRARGLLLEAAALVTARDMRSAAAKAIEATLLDMTGSVTALKLPANQLLREAVLADYRSRFDACFSGGDWDSVLRISAAASGLDDTASGWVGEAIAKHAGGLSAVPPEVLGRLPAATIAGLPWATIATSPSAALVALPPLRNSIGIDLKLIPAGTFTMGQFESDSDQTEMTGTRPRTKRRGSGDRVPRPHQVTLAESFYIGVYEVTNAQWKAVMGSVPNTGYYDDHPVSGVSWDDAVEFCRKLSALPEEQQAGRVYRLPTEAEWEYACRAGSTTRWSFGDDDSILGEYAWFKENSGRQTHPVGKKKPNTWGLFDTHGNVWEWCSDLTDDFWGGAVEVGTKPSRPFTRVYRGGDWDSMAGGCRSADRYGGDALYKSSDLGFRLALSPPGAQPPEAAVGVAPTSVSVVPKRVEEQVREPARKATKPSPQTKPSPPASSAWPATLKNSIRIDFALIPAGEFLMGSADGATNEKPAHEVRLTKPFYLGVYEVTNGQWMAVMGSVPSKWKDDDHPVEQVSWDEAVRFCRKLSSLPEEQAAGRVYRLPTEAEWEYACRAGSKTNYAFGDDEARLGEYGWFNSNSTHPVGQKKPNVWGLHDMHGNVWEWCADRYGRYPQEAVVDPAGPAEASDRVLRGGGWFNAAGRCRSTLRGGFDPSLRDSTLGFRLALSPSGSMSPEAAPTK